MATNTNPSYGSLESAMNALQGQRDPAPVGIVETPETAVSPPIEDIGAVEEVVEEVVEEEVGEEEITEEEITEELVDEEIEEIDQESQVVVIDGQEYTPEDLKEFKDSGLRMKDYTQKTQVVAAQGKQNEDVGKSLQEMDSIYRYQVNQMDEAFKADIQRFSNVDWARTARENPNEYTALKAEFDVGQQRYNDFVQGVQVHMSKVTEAQQTLQNQAREHCAKALMGNIKGFNTEKYHELCSYAVEAGMPKNAVENATDPALFLMINKAAAYDKARRIGAKKRVGQPKSLQTRRAVASTQAQTNAANLSHVAKKSGSMDDALAMYRARHKKVG